MEEKYKKYREFNWGESEEWKLYLSNLFPTPPRSKIERYRRKFYKNKIDPDFDIDYQSPSDSQNTTNTTESSSTSSSAYTPPSPPSPINSEVLLGVETMIFIIYIISLPFNFRSLILVMIGLVLRTVRTTGIPKMKIEYAQQLLTSDCFQTLMCNVVLFIDRFNYFTMLPITMAVVLYIAENINSVNAFNSFKKYLDVIIKKKEEILQTKAHIEICVGVLLLPGIFLKVNHYMIPMIYWQFMKVRYVMNPYLHNSFKILNDKVTTFRNQSFVPKPVSFLIEKFQVGFSYLGQVQGSNQNGQQQAPSGLGGCQIY